MCYARNLGIKHCDGEIIAFIDDDCVIDKEWLKEIVRPYSEDEEVVCVGGKIYCKDTQVTSNKPGTIFGTNMSFKKIIFDKFLFDTNSSFYDEMDLIDRIRNENFKVIYTDTAIVRHFFVLAEHRKNAPIDLELNLMYIYAKNSPLTKYYFGCLISPLVNLLVKLNPKLFKNKEWYKTYIYLIVYRIYYHLKKKSYSLPKKSASCFYLFYVLIIEIPIKAKLKVYIERKRLKNNKLLFLIK